MRILIVEDEVRRHTASEELPPVDERETITIEQRESIGFALIFRAMFAIYPKRTLPELVLTPTEAFLYNAVLFSYGLVLTSYYGVSTGNVGLYLTAFAVGNLTGTLTLGRLFDRAGRVPMISEPSELAPFCN